MSDSWAVMWGKLVEQKCFSPFVCLSSAALNSSVLCIFSHPTWTFKLLNFSLSVKPREILLWLWRVLKWVLCFDVTKHIVGTLSEIWRWNDVERTTDQTEWPKNCLPLTGHDPVPSVHLLWLSAPPKLSQVDLLEHNMLDPIFVLLMKHCISLN